ncbi:MAG: tetratricopeptide repeat protein [Aquificaceae bacterium]|nr:tetratricopeptide repeat protein [Aquificaceae bacterium]
MDNSFKGAFSKIGESLLQKHIEDLLLELGKSPEDANILLKLGIAYVRIGNTTKAREVYRKLRDINPALAKELMEIIYS